MSSKVQKRHRALRADDLEALSIFEFELPSLRASVDLAEIVAESPEATRIRHPTLRFAFDKAPVAVVENLLLRTAELLDIMDRTCDALGLETIFTEKRGRDRVPKDLDFRLALDLRDERIAHRVKLRNAQEPGPSWGHVRAAFGTVWPFIRAVLDGLEARLRIIRSAGIPISVPRNVARYRYIPFTTEDVAQLVQAADQLPAANTGNPADS